MKTTIMAVDAIFRFRLLAIQQSEVQPQAWEMQVVCIQEVALVLVSLGFVDQDAARPVDGDQYHDHSTTWHHNDSSCRLRSGDRTGVPGVRTVQRQSAAKLCAHRAWGDHGRSSCRGGVRCQDGWPVAINGRARPIALPTSSSTLHRRAISVGAASGSTYPVVSEIAPA